MERLVDRVPERVICPDVLPRFAAARKPVWILILRAAEEFALDVASSFVIGDRYRDVEMAHRAEARGILVLSGYGNAEYTDQSASWPRQPDHVAADLSEAVDWIVARI